MALVRATICYRGVWQQVNFIIVGERILFDVYGLSRFPLCKRIDCEARRSKTNLEHAAITTTSGFDAIICEPAWQAGRRQVRQPELVVRRVDSNSNNNSNQATTYPRARVSQQEITCCTLAAYHTSIIRCEPYIGF